MNPVHQDKADSEIFSRSFKGCYLEKRNFFRLPFVHVHVHVGNCVVRELHVHVTRFFNVYANASALESVALKAAMVLPTAP